jgi:hypothetical protein
MVAVDVRLIRVRGRVAVVDVLADAVAIAVVLDVERADIVGVGNAVAVVVGRAPATRKRGAQRDSPTRTCR